MAKNWKLPKGPSVGEWLNQLWFIHTLEYYPAVKRNQQLMNLKGIKLSEKIVLKGYALYASIYITFLR